MSKPNLPNEDLHTISAQILPLTPINSLQAAKYILPGNNRKPSSGMIFSMMIVPQEFATLLKKLLAQNLFIPQQKKYTSLHSAKR